MNSRFVYQRCVEKNGNYEEAHSIEEFVRMIREHTNFTEDAHTIEVEADEHVTDIVNRVFKMRSAFEYDRSTAAPLAAGESLIRRLCKVIIHTAGASFADRKLGSDDCVGVLVGTAHTDFTGGDLQVTHNGATVNVNEHLSASSREWYCSPACYVAATANCTFSMSPVINGTRVSFVYELHRNSSGTSSSIAQDDGKDASSHEDDYADEYEGDYADEYEGDEGDECDKEDKEWKVHDGDMHSFPIMRINPDRERALLDKLDATLADFDSVTIGLHGVYPANSGHTTHLGQGDQVLFDFLKGEYDLEIVLVVAHENRAGIYSEIAIDQVIAGRPQRSIKNRARDVKDMLVIPHTMSNVHVLDEIHTMCHCAYDQKYDVVYRISGLRVKKKQGT